MTVSKLNLWNGALTVLGERKLTSLTEAREPRYKLDDIWDNDAVNRCLQHGQWNFATRSVKLESSSSTTPTFGYQFAFDKPSDFIRTVGVTQDEYYDVPLTRYSDEAAWWFSDLDPIYVRYVSNDNEYGQDYAIWPFNFAEYVEHYLAYKLAPRLTGVTYGGDDGPEKALRKMLHKARSTDAMESPAKFPSKGSWASARQTFRGGDRGSRRQLIG